MPGAPSRWLAALPAGSAPESSPAGQEPGDRPALTGAGIHLFVSFPFIPGTSPSHRASVCARQAQRKGPSLPWWHRVCALDTDTHLLFHSLFLDSADLEKTPEGFTRAGFRLSVPWVSSERRAPSSVCCLSYSHRRFSLGIKPQSPDTHSRGKSYSSVIKPGVTTNNWNRKPINSQLFWPDAQTFRTTAARQGPFCSAPAGTDVTARRLLRAAAHQTFQGKPLQNRPR